MIILSKGATPLLFEKEIKLMPTFYDLINQMQNPDDENGASVTPDDLVREYDTTLEGFKANTNQHLNKISELETEIGRLKSSNYDLLMSIGTGSEPENHGDNEEDKAISIDDLFTK